jgi:hypothetical protein
MPGFQFAAFGLALANAWCSGRSSQYLKRDSASFRHESRIRLAASRRRTKSKPFPRRTRKEIICRLSTVPPGGEGGQNAIGLYGCGPASIIPGNLERLLAPQSAPGLINLDRSTDRNLDRSSTDDGSGANSANDTHLRAGNSGSAGSLGDSNRAFLVDRRGRCRRGTCHLLLIGWVPRQSARAMPIPRGKIFS